MTEKAHEPALPGMPSVDTDLSSKVEDTCDPRQGLPESVKVRVEDTPFVPDTTKREDPKGQYIQYNGVGTVRIMTPQDWAAVNIDTADYHEWNGFNHKRIPRSAFSDAQLQYLLRVDGRFSLVEA